MDNADPSKPNAGGRGHQNDLPIELAHGLTPAIEQALNHPLRREMLRHYDRNPGSILSPSQLYEHALPSSTLSLVSYHAAVLLQNGIFELARRQDEADRLQRFYRLTVEGDPVIRGILRAMEDRDALLRPQG